MRVLPPEPSDCAVLLCVPAEWVPAVAGKIAELEWRESWASEDDWRAGAQLAAELQEQLMGNCVNDLIAEIRALRGVRVDAEATPEASRTIDDYYSLRDVALPLTPEGDQWPDGDINLYAILRSAWNFDSIRVAGLSDLVSPTLEAILHALRGDTETSDNILQALRGDTTATADYNIINQILELRGPAPPWWDWGSERPTIADVVKALQEGQASDTDESVWDIVQTILGTVDVGIGLTDLLAKTGGDALLAVLLAVAVGQRLSLANIETNAIAQRQRLDALLITLSGSTNPSSDNLLAVLRGTTPRADYDAENIAAILEEIRELGR